MEIRVQREEKVDKGEKKVIFGHSYTCKFN